MAEEWEPQWPWTKTNMGPPAGPSDSWMVINGTLYLNFRPSIMRHWATSGVAAHIAAATKRWTSYYGSMHAGPFNTMCYENTWQRCAHPSLQG